MNYTYILKCRDGSLYTGWTTNLERRLKEHNSGKGAKYTKSRRPVVLAYYETFDTKEEAMKREYAIKQLRRTDKLKLLKGGNKMQSTPQRSIIFLDIDGVLQPCSNQYRFEHDIAQTQKDIAETMGDERYLQLDKYDVAAVYYDWDEKAVSNLKELIYRCNAEIVISSDWKRTKSLEDLKLLFRIHKLDQYITDIAPYEQFSSKWDDIKEYLKLYTDINSYVVIDDLDMEKYFRGHTVYTGWHSRLDTPSLLKAERILKYGPWWEKPCRYDNRFEDDALIRDHYKKVIFLDIDGVLNDDGEQRENGTLIDEYFVRNLFYIVRDTDAEIVLSSSWRNLYGAYAQRGFPGNNEQMESLLREFDKFHLKTAGITPIYFNGANGRPFEIRMWLCHRPEVENFVILDDDTFWNWNWLEPYVVCTASKRSDRRSVKGLSPRCVYEAVKILNGSANASRY